MNKKYIIIFIVTLIFILMYRYLGSALYYKFKNNLKVKGIGNYIWIYNEIFINKDYKFLDNNKENMIYFDIGGNNGIYSLYLNENNKNIEVHVFEPINELYQNIVWNINQTKKDCNNFIINNFGLGEIKKEVEINYFKDANGLSTIKNDMEHKKKAIINYNFKGIPLIENISKFIVDNLKSEKRKINIDTLNNYILEKKINRIDCMKIDVEGYELEVLQGISNDNFKKIKKILIEVENYRKNYTKQILDILDNNNFSYKVTQSDKDWCYIYAINNE
jgi:31-O-methyltransferase